jgi:pheromone shutdown protein TraB
MVTLHFLVATVLDRETMGFLLGVNVFLTMTVVLASRGHCLGGITGALAAPLRSVVTLPAPV